MTAWRMFFSVALFSGTAAAAYVPSAVQIGEALGDKHKVEGRTNGLSLKVALQIGESEEVVARGLLETEPGGAVRLELVGTRGAVERHLWTRGRVEATRGGRTIKSPRPFLLPFPLLQVDSSLALRNRLLSLGALADVVELGYIGGQDCYVLGGREGPVSFWIDSTSLEAVSIQLVGGVSYKFGASTRFKEITVPGWIDALGPENFRARLVVEGVERRGSGQKIFDSEWLYEGTADPED